jgi:hypothetical protein
MDTQIINEQGQQIHAILQYLFDRQIETIDKVEILKHRAAQIPLFYPPDDARYMLELQAILHPMTPVGGRFDRVGGANDGGYVMVDYGLDNTSVYNFGIGNEVTWDQAMAERGNTIYQFDHTIDAPPPVVGVTAFTRKGLGVYSDDRFVSLGDAIYANGDNERTDLVLNIDIEGGEWDILPSLSPHELSPFTQIAMELHGLLNAIVDSTFRARVRDSFDVLFATHQLVHVHANNWGAYAMANGVLAYDVLEVTLVRKSDWEFVECDERFPRDLDRPNCPYRPELRLGDWSHIARQPESR